MVLKHGQSLSLLLGYLTLLTRGLSVKSFGSRISDTSPTSLPGRLYWLSSSFPPIRHWRMRACTCWLDVQPEPIPSLVCTCMHWCIYMRARVGLTYEELLSPSQLALVASMSGCVAHRPVVDCDADMCYHHKYRSLDGTCNNLRQPMLGSSLSPLLRLLPPRYENNFNSPVGRCCCCCCCCP